MPVLEKLFKTVFLQLILKVPKMIENEEVRIRKPLKLRRKLNGTLMVPEWYLIRTCSKESDIWEFGPQKSLFEKKW